MNDKYMELVEDKHKESYLRYIKGDRTDKGYSSHQPVLIHVLNTITNGDVLEFGAGHHSTPIMHTICGEQKRKLLSIETDPSWLKKFTHYRNNYHSLEIISPEELLGDHYIFNEKYAIAFIDGVGNLRQPVIEKINADYIIVHDTQSVLNMNKDAYNYDFSMFRHVYHFDFFEKDMTSVLSNLDEIDKEISDMLTL